MGIKRITYEFDSVGNPSGSTEAPSSAFPSAPSITEKKGITNTPSNQETYNDTDLEKSNFVSLEKTGRTPSDIIILFFHKKRFPAVIFLFLCYVIRSNQIKTLEDFWVPVIMWVSVCIVWYGASLLSSMVGRKR